MRGNVPHVVIVGAGPGGLVCAMILAHRGCRVTVVEAKDDLGGRNSELRTGNFSHDLGPTFLMMRPILDEMFEETGRASDDYLDFVRLEPMYRLVFDDVTLDVTTDRARMKAQIETAFPGWGAHLDDFLMKEKKRFAKVYPCLQKDYSYWWRLFSPTLLKAMPHLNFGRSVFDTLGDYFDPERLRICFTFQAKYLGMSPWDCPAAFTILPYIEHAYGVYHVQGGLNRISHALAKVAEEEGAEVRLGARVRRVVTNGKAASGVELEDGEVIDADEVVLNADFGHAATTLFDADVLRKYTAAKLPKRRFSCSTFMLYLGLDTRYDHLAHHSIFFAGDYRKNLDEITRTKTLSADPSFYVRNASVTDPNLAPPGQSAIYVLVPVPNNKSTIDWSRERDGFRDRVLDAMEKRAGMTDLRGHIVAERVITPADWADEYQVYLGATFNLAHDILQMMYFRPHNRFEEVKHTWLVGGGTHPGSGLPTIFESGRITANMLCRTHHIPFTPPATRPDRGVLPF